MVKNRNAELFVPDGKAEDEAIIRTTHMAIAAHQDDLEIMAYDGILKCFGKDREWFFGMVVTNGSGSPRNGLYEHYTDEQMQKARRTEQKKAAYLGEFGALAMLDYTSYQVKNPGEDEIVNEIKDIIIKAKPKILYTHNLADKHDTHVAVAVKVIRALRGLPNDVLPEEIYGCEVWRSLDWLNDEDKIMFDVGDHPNIAAALIGVFDSQVCGGKRYDLATMGRRLANATFTATHATDRSDSVIYAMDLKPLIVNPQISISEYIEGYINRFKRDVMDRINKFVF